MPLILDASGILYQRLVYEREAEFEADVVSLADQIFGSSTIYIDVKKKMSGSGIVTIPDGYVIDMTDLEEPKLFVVENEIVGHDPFGHIGIQMLKFVTSFDEGRRAVRNFLMAEIQKDEVKRRRFEDACSRSHYRNVDSYLDKAVFRPFQGLVIIDEARSELHRVIRKINANISVLELSAYIADGGKKLHVFDTLYEEDANGVGDEVKRSPSSEGRAARRVRRAASDTIIVPAREDGFQETFLGENRWYAIKIGAAMKDRIKYIAAYRVAPTSAVTHIAEIKEILPYEDSGKYLVVFEGSAQEIRAVPLKVSKNSPQGPVYVKRDVLLNAECLENALRVTE